MKTHPEKLRTAAEEFSPRLETKERDREGDRFYDKDRAFSRRKGRPPVDLMIDYKDAESLRPFLMESGRIAPARVTRLNRKQQQELARAVKRARQLALLPLSPRHGF